MWIIYALLCALSLATSDALAKRILETDDERWVAWMRLVMAVPFLIPFLFLSPIPKLDGTFWLATALALPLEIVAVLIYIRAIKISPLSLTIPFLALTPIFLLLIGYVMLGERPGMQQGLGVFLIAAGAYLLNVHASKEGVLGPLTAIARERGSLLMVAVALIFSVTSSLGKLAVSHSSPLFFGPFYFILLAVLFSPFALLGKKSHRPRWRWGYLGIGVTYGMMVLFHFIALSMTHAAYMIAVKRTSILFGVAYGWFMFRERQISERLMGSAVMFAGVLLVTL